MNQHSIFIISIVVIIVIFVFLVLATMALSSEKFQDLSPLLPAKPYNFDFGKIMMDTNVPQNLRFKDATPFYQELDNGLNGTSLKNISEVISQRHPIAIETSTNWYDTQPLITGVETLGTNNGSLPKAMCICNDKNIV